MKRVIVIAETSRSLRSIRELEEVQITIEVEEIIITEAIITKEEVVIKVIVDTREARVVQEEGEVRPEVEDRVVGMQRAPMKLKIRALLRLWRKWKRKDCMMKIWQVQVEILNV